MQRLYSVTYVLRDGTKHDTVEKAKAHCKEKMKQFLREFSYVFSEYLAWREEYDDLLNYEHQQDNNY